MKIYVSLDPDGQILALSTQSDPGIQTEAEFEGALYPDKLAGYRLEADNTGVNQLIFDPDLYRERKKSEELSAALKSAQELLDALTRDTVLQTATDEQAMKMAPLYPEWKEGESYTQDQRIRFGDGGFCKVLKGHTADKSPEEAPNLYEILSDPKSEFPEYKQPETAKDVYLKGDKVTFNGTKYLCTHDIVADSPAVMPAAWKKAE